MGVKVTFPEKFSPKARLVHFEVASKCLHEEVVEKLRLGLEADLQQTFGGPKAAEEAAPNPIAHVYAFCDRFLGKNHLLTAYGEIRKLRKEVLKPPSKVIALENKQGAIKLHLQVDKYFIDLKVKVFCKGSLDYPDGVVEVAFLETNLPQGLSKSFL